MGIVSYAQNFEDVMLWRALGSIPNGFYIDVGASDPSDFSVTRAFSEHGWHGINVEPTPEAFARLQAARPGDINLQVALSAEPGRVTFYECADHTLSSLDPAIAARNRADGRDVIEREIEVMTLAELCREHAPADVHFLKIDVEGAEDQVLAGADFTRCRPWILVIEATLPLTQTLAHHVWEAALLESGYRFAWFDGLNRFYIAAERWELLARFFEVPPNVFDGFRLFDPSGGLHRAEMVALRDNIESLNAELAQERARLIAEQGRAMAEQERTLAVLAATREELAGEQVELAVARTEIAVLNAGRVGRAAPTGLVRRFAYLVRSFLTAEQRADTSSLRLEIARLAAEVDAVRQSIQLRP